MIPGDPVGNHRDPHYILWTAPASAFEADAQRSGAIDLRKHKTLGVAVIPSEATEDAQVAGDCLIDTETKSIFRAIRPRERNVRPDGTGVIDRLTIASHVRGVAEGEKAGRAGFVLNCPSLFEFNRLAQRFGNLPVEGRAVCSFGHGEGAVSQCP